MQLDNYASFVQECVESMLGRLVATVEEEQKKAVLPDTESPSTTKRTSVNLRSSIPALAHLILSHTLSTRGAKSTGAETHLLHTPRSSLCLAAGERAAASDAATSMSGADAEAAPWIQRCVALLRAIFAFSQDCETRGAHWLNAMYNSAMSTSHAVTALPNSVAGLFHEQREDASPTSSLERLQWCALLESLGVHGSPALTEDHLVLSHLLQQLHVLWYHLEDTTPQLASDAPGERTCNPLANVGDLAAPTLWYERHLLQDQCRATPAPFVLESEYRQLFANECHNEGGSAEIDLRHWCVSLLLRRSCPCNEMECRRKYAVLEPTAKQLQQIVVSIPSAVQAQQITFDERIDLVPLRSPFEQWARTAWWGEVATSAGVPDMLLLALTVRFHLTKAGLLRKQEPSLARLLCTLAQRGGSRVESIEFVFHGVAALCHARELASSDAWRAHMVPPTAIEKVAVTPELFYFYFSLLCKTHFDDDEILFFNDVKLLQQIERIHEITLSDLLSSHWGMLLIQNYFV
ncbi:hypothetical protein STCU_12242 [Strigomonas culicis]|uniref:Uncharacterized protein n=1 Tax=Strigomonas culicis TaxID=28005 RepID=S9TB46_9TRYP|nr:hypothetical protein STCU_12242 [Strigomonas culicis]|eukprot:EPY15212.1 hypothetical protein STCU_12242 [Strigomonas culicis]